MLVIVEWGRLTSVYKHIEHCGFWDSWYLETLWEVVFTTVFIVSSHKENEISFVVLLSLCPGLLQSRSPTFTQENSRPSSSPLCTSSKKSRLLSGQALWEVLSSSSGYPDHVGTSYNIGSWAHLQIFQCSMCREGTGKLTSQDAPVSSSIAGQWMALE